MGELEAEFERRVRAAVEECKKIGYYPHDFEFMLQASSAVRVAEKLVLSSQIQSGLKRVVQLGRPELSIESLMTEPQFQLLFKPNVLEAAEWRLRQAVGGI